MRLALAVAALLCAVAFGTAAASRTATPPSCRGGALAASFTAVPGSAGAGQISYALRLRNRSAVPCFVSGLAQLVLLGRLGKPLPTNVLAANRGALTAVLVTLRPNTAAVATARFSPDVPGAGEQIAGPCEPTAYRVRVTPPPGGGTVTGPIVHPTAVCEHGRIFLSALQLAGKAPAR